MVRTVKEGKNSPWYCDECHKSTSPLFFTLHDPIDIKANISKEKVDAFYA